MQNAVALQPEGASRQAFLASPQLAMKWSSYFDVYDELFAIYRGKPITFVEVGVLNGGSLFMWREFFGPQARIIGIDLNPAAQQWTAEGFEIFIGDQADPAFWSDFCHRIGEVDILLDDGGHTFRQQITTAESIISVIRDGGLIVVEDAHTSYMREFGGPSVRSFVSWAKGLVDRVNYRNPALRRTAAASGTVHRVSFFESVVALHINRAKCVVRPVVVANHEVVQAVVDFRLESAPLLRGMMRLAARLPFLTRVPFARATWRFAQRYVNTH